jgi:aspartate kinase
VVISALAGETRRLKRLSLNVAPEGDDREEDVILAAGEQVAAGLLAKLLSSPDVNIKARSLLAWQIPILTDENHGKAKILSVCPDKINHLLADDFVVIIPGFQGVTANNYITTLSFDGSDVSAAAVACALNADFCRLYKDVGAVYSANPRRVKLAQKISKISYQEMGVLASLGARIIHPDAVETAKKHGIEIHILSPDNAMNIEQGTIVGKASSNNPVVGITYYLHDANTINISAVGQKISKMDKVDILSLLKQNKVLAEIVDTDFSPFSITIKVNWLEQLDRCLTVLHTFFGLDANKPAIISSSNPFDPAIPE